MITTKNAALTAEILSGSLYIILIVIAYLTHNADMLGKMQDLINNHSNLLLSFGFAWFILAWLFGTFFDAFRDSVVENCKFKEKINWDFFFESDYTKVKQLDEFFYAYYILAVDLVISVIMAYVSIIFIYGLSAFYSPFGSICHRWILYIIVIPSLLSSVKMLKI